VEDNQEKKKQIQQNTAVPSYLTSNGGTAKKHKKKSDMPNDLTKIHNEHFRNMSLEHYL
jgi:hypothetical protein